MGYATLPYSFQARDTSGRKPSRVGLLARRLRWLAEARMLTALPFLLSVLFHRRDECQTGPSPPM
jgi:hypothetical protein